jgi:intracellular septation protein A
MNAHNSPVPVPADGASSMDRPDSSAGAASVDRVPSAAGGSPPVDRRRRVAGVVGIDLVLPFVTYYGLRILGADPWLALMLGAAGPLIRIAIGAIRTRRLERLSIFTLSIMTVGTTVGLLGGDARLLMARESWLTAAIGVWLLVSLWGSRPVLFTATLAVLPPELAEQWERSWAVKPGFRRVFRWMTIGWGTAFIVDAAARVVMAYTLPIDLVPVASVGLLVVMLILVNESAKLYGRRTGMEVSSQ